MIKLLLLTSAIFLSACEDSPSEPRYSSSTNIVSYQQSTIQINSSSEEQQFQISADKVFDGFFIEQEINTGNGFLKISKNGVITFSIDESKRNFYMKKQTYFVDSKNIIIKDKYDNKVKINIILKGVDYKPKAFDDLIILNNSLVFIDALENDTDIDNNIREASITSVSTNKGMARVEHNQILFTPNLNRDDAIINYTINSNGKSATAKVYVTVNTDLPPVAINDSILMLDYEVSLVSNILKNDTDVDNDINKAKLTSVTVDYGFVSIESNLLRFTPNSNRDNAVINYTMTSNGKFASAKVFITVKTDLPPLAVNDNATINDKEVSLLIPVLLNDTDPDDDISKATITATSVDNGSVNIESNKIRYYPNSNRDNAVINYTIQSNGKSTSAKVFVTVKTDQLPIAFDDNLELDKYENSVVINPLLNDKDSDNDITKAILKSVEINKGTAIIDDNKILFTPDSEGNNSIIDYTIESNGKSASAKVYITIIDSLKVSLNYLKLTLPISVADPSPDTFEYKPIERTLPVTVNGNSVVWESSSPLVNFLDKTASGYKVVYSHPASNDSSKTIDLKATVSNSYSELSETFNIELEKKTTINIPALTIRVKFPETEFSSESTQESDSKRLFSDLFSVKHYFKEVSSSRANIVPAALPLPASSLMLGSVIDNDISDGVVEYLFPEAQEKSLYPSRGTILTILKDLDTYIDFSSFDKNADGIIQSAELSILFNFATCSRAHYSSLCYQGSDRDFSVPGYWAAATSGYIIDTADGVRIGGSYDSKIAWLSDYFLFNAGRKKYIAGFNTIVHEMGHSVFLAPDLYTVSKPISPYKHSNLSTDKWCVMGNPHLQHDGVDMPGHMSSNIKINSGFVDPIYSTPYSRQNTSTATDINLFTSSYNPIIITNKSSIANIRVSQYIIAGMRSDAYGYDRALSDFWNKDFDGLLLSHITPTRSSNFNANNFIKLRQNVLSNTENPYGAHVSNKKTLFTSEHKLTSATKFHSTRTEHSVDTLFRIPMIAKLSDTKYELLITNN